MFVIDVVPISGHALVYCGCGPVFADNIRKFLQFQLTVNVVALLLVSMPFCHSVPPVPTFWTHSVTSLQSL